MKNMLYTTKDSRAGVTFFLLKQADSYKKEFVLE